MVCTLSAPKRTAQCCEYQRTNFRNGFWIFAAGAMFELLGWIRVMMHMFMIFVLMCPFLTPNVGNTNMYICT